MTWLHVTISVEPFCRRHCPRRGRPPPRASLPLGPLVFSRIEAHAGARNAALTSQSARIVRFLAGGRGVVRRNVGGACLHDAEEGGDRVGALGHNHANPVAWVHALGDEESRDPIGALVERTIGQAPAGGIDDRRHGRADALRSLRSSRRGWPGSTRSWSGSALRAACARRTRQCPRCDRSCRRRFRGLRLRSDTPAPGS